MTDLRKPIAILVFLIALCVAVYFVAGRQWKMPSDSTASALSASDAAAPPSAEVMAYLAQSKGFQYLVSYTDNGFEPLSFTIKKGETVRFTNNSSQGLWIAASGEKLYPSVVNGCGSSALDTCKALKNGEFWEFTFDVAGTWSYQNNSNMMRTGTIMVQ